MITTNNFPNMVTSSPSNEEQKNTLTKEDLEGKVRKNISNGSKDKNGGSCENIQF